MTKIMSRLKTFDLQTHLLVDFTRNKQEVAQTLADFTLPDFTKRICLMHCWKHWTNFAM